MINIIFIFLVSFAFGQDDDRVQDGTPVASSNALSRSVALLKFGDGSMCSASFLTKKFLVTAGHCTYRVSISGASVRIRNSKGLWESRSLKRTITHPNYKLEEFKWGPKVRNDIALVEISSEFSTPVRPLSIGSVADMTDKKTVTIAGYGLNRKGYGAGTLRTGEMWGMVREIFQFYERDGLLLTEKAKQAVCPGDSGGAVLKGSSSSLQLIGVNSMSNGCMGHSTFLRSMSEILPTYKAWIQKYAAVK